MRWYRNWWRGGAAALAVILAAGVAPAGPVNSTDTPAAKVEEIEKAGEKLMARQPDEALNLLKEAVKNKKHKAGLLLDTTGGLMKGGESGPAIVAGKPGESEAWKRISSEDPDEKMPPPKSGMKLTAGQKEILRSAKA